jgi:hypothetical protein
MAALPHVLPHLLYHLAGAAAVGLIMSRLATRHYQQLQQLLLDLAAAALLLCMCACLWPPLQTLLPRLETQHGWRVALLPPRAPCPGHSSDKGNRSTGDQAPACLW